MGDKILNSFDVWITAQGLKSKGRVVSIDNISLEGVSRLRQLILKLAVRGKLAPQDLRETVSDTFEESETYFENNLEELKIDTPPNWKVVFVEQCFTIKSGSTVEASKELENGDYLYLKVADLNLIGNEKDINISSRYLNPNEKELRAAIPSGSIIFPKRGGAIATNKKKLIKKDLFVDLNIMSISPKKGIDLNYAFYWLQGIDLAKLNSGTSVPQINHRDVGPLVFPIPPIQEQHRIVAKVDELMALCDELEQQETNHLKSHQLLVENLLGTLTQAKDASEFQTAWATLAQHFDDLFIKGDSIDQLKQTILQLAVMGKLVKQDPKDEPASVLLERISSKKNDLIKEGKIKDQKLLPKITEQEKLSQLPKGWVFVRLNNVIDVRDGTHDSPKDASGLNTYPLVTSANFVNGKIDFDGARRISEEDHVEISKRSKVDKYDILFSMIGGNLGNQVIVEDEIDFSIKNVALFKYYDKKLTNPYFFKRYFEYLAMDLQSRAKGGAQPFVSLGFLRNLVLALPPLNEQKRIVAKVDELFALCDHLRERITEAQKVANLMADAVVELV